MTTTPNATPQAFVSEAQLQQMAAEIRQEIPGAEVRLFGSWARVDARAVSDLDLLITVSDDWLASHDRWTVLDLLLFSQSHVEQRRQLHSSVVHQAYTLGWRLDLQAAEGMTASMRW
jgi:predicted nucleotidyltransferase